MKRSGLPDHTKPHMPLSKYVHFALAQIVITEQYCAFQLVDSDALLESCSNGAIELLERSGIRFTPPAADFAARRLDGRVEAALPLASSVEGPLRPPGSKAANQWCVWSKNTYDGQRRASRCMARPTSQDTTLRS